MAEPDGTTAPADGGDGLPETGAQPDDEPRTLPRRPAGRRRRLDLLSMLVLFVVAFAFYGQTVSFDFTYDDVTHIVRNPFVRDPGNISRFLPWRYFDEEFHDQGRPVFVASLLFDQWTGGGAASAFHAQSVFWHATASALVFALALLLGLGRPSAWLAALLFVVHPANVEAVAAISHREDVLVTAFSLGSVAAFLRAIQGGSRLLLAFGAILLLLALGSKESAVAAPALLFLALLLLPGLRAPSHLRLRRYGAVVALVLLVGAGWAAMQARLGFPSLLPGSGGSGLRQASAAERDVDPCGLDPVVTALGATVTPIVAVLPLACSGRRFGWQLRPADAGPAAERAASQRSGSRSGGPATRRSDALPLSSALPVEAFRAQQLLIGWPLSAQHDLARFRGTPAVVVGAGVVALLLTVALTLWRRAPMGSFAIGWFFVTTAPVAIPTILLDPVADRFLYLPCVGACLAGAWLVTLLGDRLVVGLGTGWARRVAGALAVAVLVCSGAWTARRTQVWRNNVVLFEDAVAHAGGSARAHQNLGFAYLEIGQLEAARTVLEKARRLDPGILSVRYNLGFVHERLGDASAARQCYREALQMPWIVAEEALRERVVMRLGQLLIVAGDDDELAELVSRELELRPASRAAAALRGRLRGSPTAP